MRAITDIFSDLLDQMMTLLRKEGQLARAEISEKVTQVAGGLALIVGGAVLLIPALVILLEAAVSALVENGLLPQPWSALVVGGAALLIGLILALLGMSSLKAKTLVPKRTIHQLQRDLKVAKQQTRTNNEQQRAA